MYVDKRLDGIQAVQTLSRLNRIHPGKTQTFVLDFVNDPQAALEAFKTYYREAQLTDVSDPNQVGDLAIKLDAADLYTEEISPVLLRPDSTPKTPTRSANGQTETLVSVLKRSGE